ncbi:transposase [Cohnella luojiensis]|uniref:IS1595 family transposase n=1 Tax=Cohnella luojiensis TaxID=652876 RepID=A0A4Y8M7P0_9BACL|nr:IS1595 family transposase [Cohnella luojiensis]
MSIRKFMERFPDEQACRDYLFQVRWPRGFICTKCGESKYSYIKTRNLFECSYCKTQTSTTSNTIMHRTKLPLRYWLLTFYWVASGERCSARKISKTLKLNYRTALLLLYNVRLAMYKGEYDAYFAFWIPNEPQTPHIVKKAKLRLLKKAERFIRKHYRHISERRRESYFYEFRFRNNNQHDPSTAIDKLTMYCSTTIYSLNEYRIKRTIA